MRLRLSFFALVSSVALSVGAEALAFNYNVSLNPISLLGGSLSTGVDVRVHEKVTVGPYLAYSPSAVDEKEGMEAKTIGYGARVDYSMSGHALEDGWYVAPFISQYVVELSVDETKSNKYRSGTSRTTLVNMGSTFGYGWFWDQGFNFKLGAGLMRTNVKHNSKLVAKNSDEKEERKINGAVLVPTIDCLFAWAF